jgi:hypothetical protein
MTKKTRLVTSYRVSWFFLLTHREEPEPNRCSNRAVVIGTARAW